MEEKENNLQQNETVEVESQKNQAVSDDELYTKLQTEKMLKSKRNKKIITLVSLCVSLALAVCIIVLACVPVSLKPMCLGEDYVSVKLWPGTLSKGHMIQDDEMSKFKKYYDSAFSQSYFSAIFSGDLFKYDIKETGLEAGGESDNYSYFEGSNGLITTSKKYFVKLSYNTSKVLTESNGKAYKSTFRNTWWASGKLTFKTVYIELNDVSGFQDTKVYVVASYPEIDSSTHELKGTKDFVVTITVKANTKVLYDAFEQFI